MAQRRLAGDPDFERVVQQQVAFLASKGWYHSIQLPDGRVIPGLHSLDAMRRKLQAFPIPQDLTGKTVLDIGAWTGWYSFELERRGASVTALDCVDLPEFHEARRLLHSSVRHMVLDVDEIEPATVGTYDYVLFFGVLYHLRHPLLGLEKVCSVTREAAFVETYVTDADLAPSEREQAPNLLEFYEYADLGGQLDNWYGPNTNCVLALCRSAGFARVRLEGFVDGRACLSCYRHWEPPPRNPRADPPLLSAAVNNRTGQPVFHHGKDEYVCLYFESPEPELTRDTVFPAIDGFGVPPLWLHPLGGRGWQLNFRCPPWLSPGAHEVALRTARSSWSAPLQIVKAGAHAPCAG